MAIIIENIPVVQARREPRSDDWQDFLSALKSLNVGQSFVMPKMASNYRLAIGVAQVLLDRRYITTNKIAAGVRIGRIE